MKQESAPYQLICPICQNSGTGTIFENHNPANPNDIARRIETLPKGMAAGAIDIAGNQTVVCEVCGSPVPY